MKKPPHGPAEVESLVHGAIAGQAAVRPSGHQISEKFSRTHAGAIPPNLLQIANTESNSRYLRACRQAGIKPHPARYPARLPEFFIKMLTEEGDLVVDPFAGSNVTGEVCERLKRRWVAVDIVEDYLQGSRFRFDDFCIGDWIGVAGQREFLLREKGRGYQKAPQPPSARKSTKSR